MEYEIDAYAIDACLADPTPQNGTSHSIMPAQPRPAHAMLVLIEVKLYVILVPMYA
jgi:hypothetical protein